MDPRDEQQGSTPSEAEALDLIQEIWASNIEDTDALRRIRDVLEDTGR